MSGLSEEVKKQVDGYLKNLNEREFAVILKALRQNLKRKKKKQKKS